MKPSPILKDSEGWCEDRRTATSTCTDVVSVATKQLPTEEM